MAAACVTHWLAWRRCNWGGLNYEWWLDPNTKGPGTHAHPEDHVFYIIEGTVSIAIDGEWFDAARGSYASIPGGGLPHDPGARSHATTSSGPPGGACSCVWSA